MANIPSLADLKDAANELGIAPGALRSSAERLGLLIVFGRKTKIDRNDYWRLIEGCRVKPLEQGSISAPTRGYGSSGTLDAPTNQLALETAAMLKKRLPPTSQERGQSREPVTRIVSL